MSWCLSLTRRWHNHNKPLYKRKSSGRTKIAWRESKLDRGFSSKSCYKVETTTTKTPKCVSVRSSILPLKATQSWPLLDMHKMMDSLTKDKSYILTCSDSLCMFSLLTEYCELHKFLLVLTSLNTFVGSNQSWDHFCIHIRSIFLGSFDQLHLIVGVGGLWSYPHSWRWGRWGSRAGGWGPHLRKEPWWFCWDD